MWVYDLETLQFLEVNDAAVAGYGYSREEFLRMHVSEIQVEDLSASGAGAPGGPRSELEYSGMRRHRRKNGERIDVQVISHAQRFAGRPALLVVAQNVTEHRRADAALRESEERYRRLVDDASDVIYTIDLRGRFTSVNRKAAELTGYTQEETLAADITQMVDPGDLEFLRDIMARKLAGEQPGPYEIRIVAKGGRRIPVELNGRVIYRDGRPVGFQGIARDLTERFRARQLERHNRDITLIRQMGELLLACHTVDEAYRVIGRSARDLFPDCSGAVYLLDSARSLAEPVVTWGAAEGTHAVFERDDCWALRLNRAHVSASEETDLFCRHLGDPAPPASLCVPMVGQGETVGVLHLRLKTAVPQPVDGCRELAREVARQIVLSLDNLKLRETLREQSIRDTLTRLYNRRYMEDSLERELRRADRAGQPVAVIVFDLDNFKGVNDAFGHDAGDAMLQAFGEFVRVRIRAGDIACRYGGDEFVLILPGASLRDSVVRAHKLREGSRDLVVSYKGRTLGPLTLSVGVAVFPEHGRTANDLLVAADRALYAVKQQGRDRVEVAETGA
jgi:diguanylate cyclase (GGDEF)-like protein/PAS domain S-box-containing protein